MTAVEELNRRIELAKEALSVSEQVARTDPSTGHDAMKLNAQLKDEIEGMWVELAELGGRRDRQVERFALSHDDVASYRPDTRRVEGSD